jgi:GT2 family glycosyltransferase
MLAADADVRGHAVADPVTETSDGARNRSTFLICTRNRQNELHHCLESLLRQTVLPDEVVIVDASDKIAEHPWRAMLEPAGVRLVYLNTPAGRTRQLNVGIRASSGDPIFMIDDDVALDPGFHGAVLSMFASHGPELGGVQGTVIDDTYGSFGKRAYRALFLQSRHTKDRPGRLLPSGYYTTPVRPTEARDAQALRLCGLAFRRQVLQEFSFDESLQGYAFKEDVDFSYRVSQRYRLMVCPEARFRHFKAPVSRISEREKSRMHIVNNYELFRKNLEGTVVHWAAFSWALLGRFIYEAVRSAARRDPGYVLGAWDGLKQIIGKPEGRPGSRHGASRRS